MSNSSSSDDASASKQKAAGAPGFSQRPIAIVPSQTSGQSHPNHADQTATRSAGAQASHAAAPHRAAPTGALNCRLAHPNEIAPALSIILSNRGRPANDLQVREFMQSIAQRDLPVNVLWVAEQGGQLRWAIFPVVSPGRTVLLFMPPSVAATNRAAAAALTDAICGHYQSGDIHLAQVLLDPTHVGLTDFLGACRFMRMAELIYMQMPVHRAAAMPKMPAGFEIANYSARTRPLFEQAILRSYEQSLDCPKLAGLRDIDDILTGHMASGEFDPHLWFVVSENGPGENCPRENGTGESRQGKAVLLLSRLLHSDAVELVYLGIAPDARRRGLGQYLMRLALSTIVKINYRRLTLAVDSQNTPALRLYYGNGLAHAGTRLAYMRNLREKRNAGENDLGALG